MSHIKKQVVLVILGPTATGKSALAVHLAKRYKGEIISADSRQVYKYLNIGTNKITKKEMGGIPHHLLGILDPRKTFSVDQYKKEALKKLEEIAKRNHLPIIVGGTGFYIDAVVNNQTFPHVKANLTLRKKLERHSASRLYQTLKKKDPRRAKNIDKHNKVRLIRALEIIEAIGKVPSYPLPPKPYSFVYIGLNPGLEELEKRMRARLAKQLPQIIRESKKLHAQGLSYKRMHELGLEYRFVAKYLQKKISRKELEEKLYIAIRQYAKRQITWFKRNKEIKWFGLKEYGKIENYIKKLRNITRRQKLRSRD